MTDTPGLLDAMVAVQAETHTLPKDATNPHFGSKFVPLDTIVENVGPLLAKHQLVWMALPVRDSNGEPALHYKLLHAPSRECVDGVMPLLLQKQDSQSMGSAITYARRYALCAVLNLVADDDDDGAANTNTGGQAIRESQTGFGKSSRSDSGPSESQKQFLLKIKDGKAGGIEKPSRDEWIAMLNVVAPGLEFEPGWMDKLTRKQASELLGVLKDGPRPSTVAPSDLSDVPWEGAAQ
jgi:hypothetical protein